MSTRHADLLRSAWAAFGRGEVEAVAQALDPHVRWYAAGEADGEGACRSRDDATAFLRRALAEGMTAELLDVREAGDRVVAVIHTHVPEGWQRGPQPHGELVSFRDGLVTEVVVYATVEDALQAAGLNPG